MTRYLTDILALKHPHLTVNMGGCMVSVCIVLRAQQLDALWVFGGAVGDYARTPLRRE